MFKIEYLESVWTDDLPGISKADRDRIKRAIEERLAQDPVFFGKPLRYSLKGCRRMRVGSYRVIFKIDSQKVVLVLKISHRKAVYKLKSKNIESNPKKPSFESIKIQGSRYRGKNHA